MDTISGASAAAAARLRRTFRYPDPDDLDDIDDSTASGGHASAQAMDEQEQERLIKQLGAQNARRDNQFRLALLALPIASALPYVPALLRSRTRLLSTLALTSLAATAYVLHHLPPGVTGISPLDRWNGGRRRSRIVSGRNRYAGRAGRGREEDNNEDEDEDEGYADEDEDEDEDGERREPRPAYMGQPQPQPQQHQHRSPLEQYLPYLNLGLCVLTALLGPVSVPPPGGHAGPTRLLADTAGLGNLPAIVYAVILLAKVVMGSVDPERELARLRYGYKGA